MSFTKTQFSPKWLIFQPDWPIEERRRWIDRGDPELSLRRQCELLGVARSGLYYRPVEEREENLELLQLLD